MCGFYGQNFDINPEQRAVLDQQLFHRGPDDQQHENFTELGLYHARLAILDAVGGKQPMHRSDLVIVFNGEIYNHLELREKYNLNCERRSDTETLMALYEKLGLDMLKELDGMFAFAIYNRLTGQLLLARDRMGEKPLYYYYNQGKFAFASELNTLAALFPLQLNQSSLKEFLIKGWIGPVHTVYEQVFSLTQGHFMLFDCRIPTNNLEQTTWWKPYSDSKIEVGDFTEAKERVYQSLQQSVKRRIESSDLPVGCFLSGGIDSGLVTAIASQYNTNMHTFTFRFEGAFDESEVAESVAKKYHTNHNLIDVNYANLSDDIGRILLSYGEPYADDSCIPSYYVSQEAKKFVTVVLNGDGGDELFAGYRRYVPAIWPSAAKSVLGTMGRFNHWLPSPKSKMSIYNYFYRLLRLQNASAKKRYLAGSTDLFWDNTANLNLLNNSDSMAWYNVVEQESGLSDLQKILYSDYLGLLPQVLLKKIDIATMQHSLESRTVFFSPEILKICSSLPDSFLLKTTQTKRMLRSIAADLLPENVHKLPKRGFEPPLHQWLSGVLKDIVHQYLLTPKSVVGSILGQNVVKSIVERTIPVPDDRWAKLVFSMFSLEYWIQNRPTNILP